MPKVQVPVGSAYAVVALQHNQIAFCPADLETVVRAMIIFEPLFGCRVVRLEDNAPIWPWHVKGGFA